MPTVINTDGRGSLVHIILLVAAMISLCGCRFGAASESSVTRLPVKMVWAGHQGGGPMPTASVEWVSGPEDLVGAGLDNPVLRMAVEQGGMDWMRHGLIWIRMGQKRTGGFGLRLAGSEAVVEKGVVTVPVRWRRPPEGAIVTQMITSPCMLLKLPRGDYRQIVVTDTDGRERARTQLPPSS